jgi:hypothetical protein
MPALAQPQPNQRHATPLGPLPIIEAHNHAGRHASFLEKEMKTFNALTAALCLGSALLATTPAVAQACKVPDQTVTDDVWLGKVMIFGDIRVRISEIGPEYRWVKIDVKVPGMAPTLGLQLFDKQSTKVTVCGPEVTITYLNYGTTSYGRIAFSAF